VAKEVSLFGSAPVILSLPRPSLVIWEAGDGSEAGSLIKADRDFAGNAQRSRAVRPGGGLLLMQSPEDMSHMWASLSGGFPF